MVLYGISTYSFILLTQAGRIRPTTIFATDPWEGLDEIQKRNGQHG